MSFVLLKFMLLLENCHRYKGLIIQINYFSSRLGLDNITIKPNYPNLPLIKDRYFKTFVENQVNNLK